MRNELMHNEQTELKQKASEFYYKNIWQNNGFTQAYLDHNGNFTKRPSAFYIGNYTGEIDCDEFYREVERRLEEHQRAYSIGASIPSELGKYTDHIRKSVKNWEE